MDTDRINPPPRRVEPFRALMYDATKGGPLADLVAPPYDLIDQARQNSLYDRSPFNIVRIELNRDADRYAASARTLHEWLANGVLRRAARPALYFCSQFFESDRRHFRRDGFICQIRLEDFRRGRILPHERTFPAARQDRMALLAATETNVSSIFGLYGGAHPEIERLSESIRTRPAALAVTDDLGIRNELRPLEDPSEIATVQSALENEQILIADGHHRYETALEYSRRRRAADAAASAACGYDYTMMTLVGASDPGLVILPTHRVLARLDRAALAEFDSRARAFFAAEEFTDTASMRAAMAAAGRGVIGAALAGRKPLLIRLANPGALAGVLPDAPEAVRALDVSVLHALVLNAIFGITAEQVRAGGLIDYTIDAGAAVAAVVEGRADGAFLMNPPSIADVERVSASGATMPEKSTYFFPKLLTGLVMNPLGDPLATAAG